MRTRVLILVLVMVMAAAAGYLVWNPDREEAEKSWRNAGRYLKNRYDMIPKK